MLSAEILEILNSRLQNITFNFDKPFGNMDIILCGDLYQLPPVLTTAIYKRSKKSINNECLWQTLNYFPLTEKMRQKDLEFLFINNTY